MKPPRDLCPAMPRTPEKPSPYGEYRQSRENIYENILSRRVMMPPDLLDDLVEDDEDVDEEEAEREGRPAPEP